MTTARHFGVRSLLLLLALGLCTACGSSSDSDDEGPSMGDLTEQDLVANSNGTGMVSDFQLSDIEVMEEYAVKMKLMKQQFMRYMSDGYQGSDLMCGPGEHSDATKLFELQTEMLENLDRYRPVLERLEQQGTYTTPTTRGLPASFLDFWNALSGSAQVSMDAIRATMNEGKLWSNYDAQQELFNSLTTSQRDGETNYRTWFNRLNNNDQKLIYKAPQIHLNWLNLGASASKGGGISQYYDAAVKSGNDNTAERVYQMGKDLSEKGGQLMVDLIDKASGGGVSKVTDFIEAVEEEAALVEFIYKVTKGEFKNVSKEDIKKALKHYTADKLRDNLPDEISKSDFANDVFNDLMDYIHDTILQDDKDGDAAKEVGKTQLSIENNTGKKIKTVIAQNNNSGKIVYVKPDNSGSIIVTVGEGTVTVTVITEDGQRSTQTVSADKAGGMKELQGVPYVREPQLGVNPTELEFESVADLTGQKVNVTTNCAYMAAKPSAEWIKVKLSKDGVLNVGVEKNPKDEDREGTVRIYALNEQKQTQKSFTLKVKQKREGEVGVATLLKRLTINVTFGYLWYTKYHDGEQSNQGTSPETTDNYIFWNGKINSAWYGASINEDFKNVKVTASGSRLHFECSRKPSDSFYWDGKEYDDVKITFDINGVSGAFTNAGFSNYRTYFGQSTLDNFEVDYQYVEKLDNGALYTITRKYEAGSIPFGDYSTNSCYYTKKGSDGLSFKNFEMTKVWDNDAQQTNTTEIYEYRKDNKDKLQISLYFRDE